MTSTPHLDPRSEGIGHAIQDKKPTVPIRQRHYAWTKDQVVQLFEDLDDAIDDNAEDYFLGLVVVTENKGRPEIVDGQQRLATCVMLLAAIRDFLIQETPDRETAEEYERSYLIGYDPKEKRHVPRLKLNVDDADFFMDFVLRRPGHEKRTAAEAREKVGESNQRIRAAAVLARERVKMIVAGGSKEHRTERLIKWVEFIHNSARVIWFSVSDREHAYRIFETLNDRGLDLTKSDLIKNHLFELAEDRWMEVHQHWSKMMGVLESVAREEPAATYIRHYWIARNGPTRERELFKAIKGAINGSSHAVEFAKELAEQAPLYAALLNSDHEHWRPLGTNTKKDVSTLVMFKAERIRPLVFAAAYHFEPHELKKAMRLFVACTVRFVIAGGVAGTMERTFGEVAKKVTEGMVKTARELAKQLSSIVPNDRDFEDAFARARVSKPQLARYYLRVLEAVRRGDKDDSALSVDESEERATLEHIMPQNPSPEWNLNTASGRATLSECVNRIGNLTLMRRRMNGDAADSYITEKAKYYAAEAGLYLTSDLGSMSTWGPADIEKRQRQLAKYAVKAWSLKV